MEVQVLKQDIIEKIKADSVLMGMVAKALGPLKARPDEKGKREISIGSMYRILRDKDLRLTQKTVLKIISKHLNIEEADLLILKDTEEVFAG